jgi:glycine betaine/proline transport system substrate-binding protein
MTKIRIKKGLLLTILSMTIMVMAACGADGDDVITIGKAPYDYEEPMIEVATIIAEEQGYEVEVVEGEVGFMFQGLAEGDIDIWSGVWLPAIHGSYQEDYSDRYELGSAIFEDAPTGWVVPEYMEDINSIADLQGNEDLFNNQLVGFEPGSGMMLVSEDVIDAYDLDMEVLEGSMAGMMAEADYAIEQEEPIVFLGWRPHTMMVNYDIKILDDPEGLWDLDDMLWGINFDFEEKAPEMYNFVSNFEMSLDETEEFLYRFQEQEEDIHDVAQQWVEDNREDIDLWLEN